MDGFRKCLENDFSSIYVFNLRGNARTQGELRRKEAGNVFGHGSRTPISITLLVKSKKENGEKAKIKYLDIGDYHSREDKLEIVKKYGKVINHTMNWVLLNPNEHGDWLNQRNEEYGTYLPLAPNKKFDVKSQSIFITYSLGIASARDAWVYNSSSEDVVKNMNRFIDFYNEQRKEFNELILVNSDLEFNDFASKDSTKIRLE